jgi:apolipoprotein D and lipocalin family protein
MKMILSAALTAFLFVLVPMVLRENDRPLRVVPHVDLSRYAGLWHEIARLPNRFQEKCAGDVTAHYTLRPDGKIDVLNRCRVEDGRFIEARGVARHADEDRPSSVLEVRFAPAILSFLPQVWGDYQIIVLAPDYSYAVVGAPGREYLWILSRSPQMDAGTYRALVEEARQQGFNVDLLLRTN